MRRQFYGVLLLVSSLVIGCSDESVLQRSVFIEDSENPGLPKYSELGYNTFGAYFDRQVFASSDVVPVKVIATGGNVAIDFLGSMGDEEMSLTLLMSDFDPESYEDLLALQDMNIDLTDEDYTILINDQEVQILNGTFHFIRAQRVVVDKELFEIILSGTFEFQALLDEDPITIAAGRFDVGVMEDNFYDLEQD